MKAREWLLLALAAVLSAALLLPVQDAPEAGIKADVAVLFTPEDEATRAIVEVLDAARAEILVAMFTFTNRDLAQALVRARERGVAVRVLIDAGQAQLGYSKSGDLREAGIDVVEVALGETGDGQDIRYHNKFAVIDRAMVVSGSFNWTHQADRENYENLMLLRSEKLARIFQEKFEEHWLAFSE